eukprot:Blabericola_migrator_1__7357@NODE_373_length_9251_cov_2588_298889_g298_i0_p1_GENE_NODE_373_length_9251_cov_2588_298889_g298_i0NODE_373_length_9251_cov_2588_298889_g298_i0_p1_ORF_typecomplete_len628_score104_52DUF747/PF05346_11/9_5e76_NODE_373_length_9251_cov_2588_298889_g298_i048966779
MASIHVLRSSTSPENLFEYLKDFAGVRCAGTVGTLFCFVKDEVLSHRPALAFRQIWKESPGCSATHRKEVTPLKARAREGTNAEINAQRGTIPANYFEEFLNVFVKFEKMVGFGVVLCIEALLFDAVVMPIKAFIAAMTLVTSRPRTSPAQVSRMRQLGRQLKLLLRLWADRIITVMSKLQIPTRRGTSKTVIETNSIRQSSRPRESPERRMSDEWGSRGDRGSKYEIPPLFSSSPHPVPHPRHSSKQDPEEAMASPIFTAKMRQSRVHLNDLFALIDFSILILTSLFFRLCVDVSGMYHFVRGQALLKLYVLYNMLEITERMWRSLEMDMMDDLRVLVDVWVNGTGAKGDPRSADQVPVKSLEEHISTKVCWRACLAVLGVIVHTGMHLCRGLLLCITMKSSESGMFLLLVSNNWGELKSTVFKKQTHLSLWPIAASDVVERFQICADIIFVTIQFSFSPRTGTSVVANSLSWLLLMLVIEMFVDFCKHAFLIKFNKIQSDIYVTFKRVCMADALFARSPTAITHLAPKLIENQMTPIPSQGMSSFSNIGVRRMGFLTLPFLCYLVCFIPKFAFIADVNHISKQLVVLACLFVAQLTLTMLVVAYCIERKNMLSKLDSVAAQLAPQ